MLIFQQHHQTECPLSAVCRYWLKINLLYTPGHSGIQGNIIADKHAKDTAFRVFKSEIVASINVSIEGIVLGIEVALQCFAEKHVEGHGGCVYIFCDCQKATDVLT